MIENKKSDIRSLKTKKQIRQALLILLKNNKIEDIKINQITKMINVSRNTFYTHYNSINDVLKDIFNNILFSFNQILDKFSYLDIINNPYNLLKEISILGEENPAVTEYILFSKYSSDFVQELIDALTEKIYLIYKQERDCTITVMPYLINFLVSGSIQIMYKWYKENKVVPIEEILTKISQLIEDGIPMIRNVKSK